MRGLLQNSWLFGIANLCLPKTELRAFAGAASCSWLTHAQPPGFSHFFWEAFHEAPDRVLPTLLLQSDSVLWFPFVAVPQL